MAALKGTPAYDYYRTLVSRLLKRGGTGSLPEPVVPDVEELLGDVEEEAEFDA